MSSRPRRCGLLESHISIVYGRKSCMSAVEVDYVSAISGVEHKICQAWADALLKGSNPMSHCSTESFKAWYSLQYQSLSGITDETEHMATALGPLKAEDIPEQRIGEFIHIGSQILLELEKKHLHREVLMMQLLWVVHMLKNVDEKHRSFLSQVAVEFYRRHPECCHSAAGHDSLILFLTNANRATQS